MPRTIFSLSTFKIFKKAYFQISKSLGQCFTNTLCKYSKKDSCQSQNT